MTIDGDALELRILIGEADRWDGRPLHEAILARLMERGMAGATVLRGIEGFGRNAHLHTSKLLRLSEDLPILIDVIDSAARIRAILPELDEMVADGLVTVHAVEVVLYRGRGPEPAPG
jgi:uncharacterized protein